MMYSLLGIYIGSFKGAASEICDGESTQQLWIEALPRKFVRFSVPGQVLIVPAAITAPLLVF